MNIIAGAVFMMGLEGCALVYDYSDHVAESTSGGGCESNGSTGNVLGAAKWITTYSSTSQDSGDFVHSLAVTEVGDIYFTAEFEGEATIGGTTLPTDFQYALDMAKLDGSGAPLGFTKLGERTPDMPDAGKGLLFVAKLALDQKAQPIVGGTLDGTMDFGLKPPTQSMGFPDAYLQKRSVVGDYEWGRAYGDANSQLGTSVAADKAGGAVLTGYFNYSTSFDGPCAALTAVGDFDVFVTKFTNTGACEWSKSFGTANRDIPRGVAFDLNDRISVVGEYSGSLTFGVSPMSGTLTVVSHDAGTGVDHFLVELDSKGAPLFAKTFPSATGARIFVATDQDNNIIVVENVSAMPTKSMTVQKFTPDGVLDWQKEFTSTGSIAAFGMDVDAVGDVLITGLIIGSAQLGSFPLTADADGDAFILSLNGSVGGNPLAATTLTGAGTQVGIAIRHDPRGGFVVAGNFDTGITSGCDTLTAQRGSDVFIAKFGP